MASTDGTLQVIDNYRHSRMKLNSEADSGIYDALNKGIALANGDVIGIMHSDDVYAHDRVLDNVVQIFKDAKVNAVYGDLNYISAGNSGRIVRRWKAGCFKRNKFKFGWMPPHPTLFLRKEVFMSLGNYDTTYQISGDFDAILRWLRNANIKFFYLPQVLVNMRLGGESNRSISRILRKSFEGYQTIRKNNVGGFFTLVLKNLRKLPQFINK
ncbi:glycosyltransferase [Amylibacter sp.]|nr:glycosyltransferase [Amylibacter sp.]